MEIQELIIKKYGKFSDYHMAFRPGINIISGGNETGKTTIHSFIRAMFYGLNRARGRAARMDEYQLRQPWDSPGAFLGSMRILEDQESYRIDRCFDRSAKPLGLVCETRALESEHPQEDLEVLLGGLSETAFLNSVFIPQAHSETDDGLAAEIRNYMMNCDSTGSGEIDVTRALQGLRKRKKQLEQQKKKEDAALEEKIAAKQEQADQLRRNLEMLKRQAGTGMSRGFGASGGGSGMSGDFGASDGGAGRTYGVGAGSVPGNDGNGFGRGGSWEAAWGNDRQDIPSGNRKRSDSAVSPAMRILLIVMLAIAGALTLGGIFLAGTDALRIFLGVFTVIFWGMAIGVHALFAPVKSDGEKSAPEQAEEPSLPPGLLEEIGRGEDAYRKLQDELEILYQEHVRPEGSGQEIAALTLAIDRICELSDRIYRQNGGRINERASEILGEITGGRYRRIVMDDTGEIRIHTPDRVLGVSQVSGGTMQQIYFALRMAAGELLGNGSKLPLILDETFALYDDRRLEATLRWLKKSGRQVILFTCQSREREMLKKL
ncbi:MAG: AAA family ATPase [Lachnospiraceae bacterium]|nr:AAA family ATPase [Lachnospiraceae bacterium]